MGHRRSSSVIDSDIFDISRPISCTPPPLFDAGSASRKSDEYPLHYYYGHHACVSSDDGSKDLDPFKMMSRTTEVNGKVDWVAGCDAYRHQPDDFEADADIWNYEEHQTLSAPLHYPERSNSRPITRSEFVERSSFILGNCLIEVDLTANEHLTNGEVDQPRDQYARDGPRDRTQYEFQVDTQNEYR